jgi:hypothetical protein
MLKCFFLLGTDYIFKYYLDKLRSQRSKEQFLVAYRVDWPDSVWDALVGCSVILTSESPSVVYVKLYLQ